MTDDRPHTLSAGEAEAYAAEIAFVDYFRDSAAQRFQNFRQSQILAVGSGLTLTALVRADLHVGVRTLHVMLTGECPTDRAKHQEYLQAARRRDPDQTLREQTVTTGWEGDEEAASAALAPFDAVVHVSDRPMLARARMLDRVCRAQGKALVQAVVVGDQAWIGPLVDPDQEDVGGWESAWRRLQATRPGTAAARRVFAFADDPAAPVSQHLTQPTAALVANQMSFAVFKHLTGIPAHETRGGTVCLDLETLATRSHRFLAHPYALPLHGDPSAEAFAERIGVLEQAEPVDGEVFSRRVLACFDDALGLFTAIDEDDWEQLPLHVSRVTVSDPAGLSRPGEPLTAVGVGTDLSMARQRAARRACELYAASLVDQRRMVQANGEGARVWGWDLTERRPQLVPAASVFPTLRGLAPSAATAPWLASGFSWAEALTTALTAVCQQLTVAEVDPEGEPFPPVDLDTGPLDEQGARLRRILDTWAVTVAAYEVTGALNIPTFAFRAGDATVAYGTDVDVAGALRAGLEQVVRHEQARANRQPAYAPDEVPELPKRLRGIRPTALQPRSDGPATWADRQHRLHDALARHGSRIVAVPLDHDPTLAAVLPCIVNLAVEPRQS